MFVYGSLQRGRQYHSLLGDSPRLGSATTPPAYVLLDLGPYPGLMRGGATAVRGEVYEVSDATLAVLDELEEHPEVYLREPIEIPEWPGTQAYFIRREHATGAVELPGGVWPPEPPRD